jgi:hypothetical protein
LPSQLTVYPPNHFSAWVAGPPARAALALGRFAGMILNVYVDALNLYYGCLYSTPYKWLAPHAFCQASFPADQINRIRYFTARIPANAHDPAKPVRQEMPRTTITKGRSSSRTIATWRCRSSSCGRNSSGRSSCCTAARGRAGVRASSRGRRRGCGPAIRLWSSRSRCWRRLSFRRR